MNKKLHFVFYWLSYNSGRTKKFKMRRIRVKTINWTEKGKMFSNFKFVWRQNWLPHKLFVWFVFANIHWYTTVCRCRLPLYLNCKIAINRHFMQIFTLQLERMFAYFIIKLTFTSVPRYQFNVHKLFVNICY